MILRHDDPLVTPLQALGEPIYLLDSNPTVERIAKLIFDQARALGLDVDAASRSGRRRPRSPPTETRNADPSGRNDRGPSGTTGVRSERWVRSEPSGSVRNDRGPFRTIRVRSERSGSVPNDQGPFRTIGVRSERSGSVPNDQGPFRTIRVRSERSEFHSERTRVHSERTRVHRNGQVSIGTDKAPFGMAKDTPNHTRSTRSRAAVSASSVTLPPAAGARRTAPVAASRAVTVTAVARPQAEAIHPPQELRVLVGDAHEAHRRRRAGRRAACRRAASATVPSGSGMGSPCGSTAGWPSISSMRSISRSRHGVLELLGLVVHLVPAHAHHLHQELLDEPVPPEHQRRQPLAGGRQAHAGVRLVVREPRLGQRLHHGRGRARHDAERRREAAHRARGRRARPARARPGRWP